MLIRFLKKIFLLLHHSLEINCLFEFLFVLNASRVYMHLDNACLSCSTSSPDEMILIPYILFSFGSCIL